MKILVVEDHIRVNHNICLFLRDKKFSVASAFNGNEALEKIREEHFDVIILDRMLPQKNGIELCSELRASGINTPILMLTALGELENKIEGFDAGADDYLIKPFSLEELFARVKALLRRKELFVHEKLSWKEFEIDGNLRKVFKNNKEIALAIREFDLLFYLAKNKGKLISKEELLEKVWGGGDSLFFSETVEVHISYLRKKLGKEVITTVRGGGYIIE